MASDIFRDAHSHEHAGQGRAERTTLQWVIFAVASLLTNTGSESRHAADTEGSGSSQGGTIAWHTEGEARCIFVTVHITTLDAAERVALKAYRATVRSERKADRTRVLKLLEVFESLDIEMRLDAEDDLVSMGQPAWRVLQRVRWEGRLAEVQVRGLEVLRKLDRLNQFLLAEK